MELRYNAVALFYFKARRMLGGLRVYIERVRSIFQVMVEISCINFVNIKLNIMDTFRYFVLKKKHPNGVLIPLEIQQGDNTKRSYHYLKHTTSNRLKYFKNICILRPLWKIKILTLRGLFQPTNR